MTEDQKAPIISHMNEDHADAILAYVLAFADVDAKEVQSAVMTDIDVTGIDIAVNGSEGDPIRINYKNTGVGDRLESASDARKLLVDMVKEARKRLG